MRRAFRLTCIVFTSLCLIVLLFSDESSFDLFRRDTIDVQSPEISTSLLLGPKEVDNIATAAQLVPNWIPRIATETPLSVPIVDVQGQLGVFPRSLDECGDAYVLDLRDAGADTGLSGPDIIVYFSYDSTVYKFPVVNAKWLIDGQTEPIDLTSQEQKNSLQWGQVDYLCYWSVKQLSRQNYADPVFAQQYVLSGDVWLIPR